MFSHVTLGVSDLGRAGAFYDALLTPLGLVRREVKPDGGPASLCWHEPGVQLPRFYAYQPYDGRPCSAGNGTMVAFLAPSPHAVDQQGHAAALLAGGTDDGSPGLRPRYAPDYYGAYLRDPDGNKVHLVFRGDIAPRPAGGLEAP
ncbi:VOC family protein [Sphingomonas soli]|uniref:VOC family protein n=1 Tax=Sphingomonas soli TaxID=266127 RepID=UPI0008332B44|nr:VOC family protein [Sphingomonas soli]